MLYKLAVLNISNSSTLETSSVQSSEAVADRAVEQNFIRSIQDMHRARSCAVVSFSASPVVIVLEHSMQAQEPPYNVPLARF